MAEVARIWPQFADVPPEDRRAARDRRQIRGLSGPPDRRHRMPTAATRASTAGRTRLCGAAGPVQRSSARSFRRCGPRTIGQAGRIDGITPAALTLLVAHVRRAPRAAPQPDRGSMAQSSEQGLVGPRTGRRTEPVRWTIVPVSRETAGAAGSSASSCCCEWHAHTNLIARSTIPNIWTRHVADSLQLLALAPDAKCWVDLGSGAGFPGLVIACALAGRAGADGPSGRKHRQEGRVPARSRAANSSPGRGPRCAD